MEEDKRMTKNNKDKSAVPKSKTKGASSLEELDSHQGQGDRNESGGSQVLGKPSGGEVQAKRKPKSAKAVEPVEISAKKLRNGKTHADIERPQKNSARSRSNSRGEGGGSQSQAALSHGGEKGSDEEDPLLKDLFPDEFEEEQKEMGLEKGVADKARDGLERVESAGAPGYDPAVIAEVEASSSKRRPPPPKPRLPPSESRELDEVSDGVSKNKDDGVMMPDDFMDWCSEDSMREHVERAVKSKPSKSKKKKRITVTGTRRRWHKDEDGTIWRDPKVTRSRSPTPPKRTYAEVASTSKSGGTDAINFESSEEEQEPLPWGQGLKGTVEVHSKEVHPLSEQLTWGKKMDIVTLRSMTGHLTGQQESGGSQSVAQHSQEQQEGGGSLAVSDQHTATKDNDTQKTHASSKEQEGAEKEHLRRGVGTGWSSDEEAKYDRKLRRRSPEPYRSKGRRRSPEPYRSRDRDTRRSPEPYRRSDRRDNYSPRPRDVEKNRYFRREVSPPPYRRRRSRSREKSASPYRSRRSVSRDRSPRRYDGEHTTERGSTRGTDKLRDRLLATPASL
jgi:hypothetical protein